MKTNVYHIYCLNLNQGCVDDRAEIRSVVTVRLPVARGLRPFDFRKYAGRRKYQRLGQTDFGSWVFEGGLCGGRADRIAVFVDLDVGGRVAGVADDAGRVPPAEAAVRGVFDSRRASVPRRGRPRVTRVRGRAAGPAIVERGAAGSASAVADVTAERDQSW